MSSDYGGKIIICIPAFNEGKTISDIVNKSKKYANEVIVYDDGSTDDTYEVSKSTGATVIRNPEKENATVVELLTNFLTQATHVRVNIIHLMRNHINAFK